MHTGEEIIHTIASKNLSFATGWLFLSIALGSVLTFTFFAAISSSFYCCHKPIKNNDEDTQGLINSGNPAQKLHFPNVPSTVYPTTQSIFQQEDNEVIDSLCPAYRELPSAHFSYVSTFNGSITSCCVNNESTILPNSTKTSLQPHTSSLSSEQLKQSSISERSTSQANPSRISINIASPDKDWAILRQSASSCNAELVNDSSLSIHIIAATENPQQLPRSITSGLTTEEDVTIQGDGKQESVQILEPTIHDGHMNELAMNDDQGLNKPVINDGYLKEPVNNDQWSNKPATNGQRLYTKMYEPAAKTSAKNTNHDAITTDCSQGASSFGGMELSPKTRRFSPDYYALTFRREGSGLSDVSCSSLRGASVFAGSCKKQTSPVMTSPSGVHERGASVFGQIPDTDERLHPETEGSFAVNELLSNHKRFQLQSERSFVVNKTGEQFNIQSESLNPTHESSSNRKIFQPETKGSFGINERGERFNIHLELFNRAHESTNHKRSQDEVKAESKRPCSGKEIRDEHPSYTHPTKISLGQTPSDSMAEISVNSVHSVDANASKLQSKNENVEGIRKDPICENIRAVSTMNQRPYSCTSAKHYTANVEESERDTRIRSSLLNDNGNNNEKSAKPEMYNNFETNSKKLIALTNNHITPNYQQHGTLHTTRRTTSHENTGPITILPYASRDDNKPIKTLDSQKNMKTREVNSTYQSLRGASHLGHLGDDDDCSDSDAFWDSVSLSFAYESPSEEDSLSHFDFKEN